MGKNDREAHSMREPFTVAICGCGSRGLDAYAPFQTAHPEQMKIVAGADPRPERLEKLRQLYGVSPDRCFASDEQLFSQPRLADAVIIATMDKTHVKNALAALDKGYHVLLEKPISPDLAACLALRERARRTGRAVVVCHVLRYTRFYGTLHALLDRGEIGRLLTIEASENIGWWHFAHSFVRGNWRRQDETSPMILQKCCHDMDIFRWLAGRRCLAVQSFGCLDFFRPENAPAGAAARCMDCPAREGCRYDAERLYISDPHCGIEHIGPQWPVDVVATDPTPEKIRAALRTGPYGRCVFRCDNDVADHQTVNLLFEGGLTATFTVSAFTDTIHRTVKLTGTQGEIWGDMGENTLTLRPFGGAARVIDLKEEGGEFSGHGGGDFGLLHGFFQTLAAGGDQALTGIEASVESHVMALAAERSRLAGGKTVELAAFEREAMA